ncbi:MULTISPECIES: hypothetical protein [Alteromonadales]|uniref:DUF2541 family protein n=1 Tax=Litorilituus sediminis TaxID=718192 RepID=A0A4P6P3B5_9GAMM|nr:MULTISPECIES: hypothetical protein [Alteromonadales]QBG34449.1 hypothetical protein EMK97_01200 [Litorilituus sediminis]
MKTVSINIFLLMAFLSVKPAYSASDWWSGVEKQSYNNDKIYIGTKLYQGEGELVLSCSRRGVKAEVTFLKSRLNPRGILFKVIVDDGKWIKNSNAPEYSNSFETYMFHNLVDSMKKGKEIHIIIDGHRYYSGSLMGFTEASKKLECI